MAAVRAALVGLPASRKTLIAHPEQFPSCGIHRLGGLQIGLRMGCRIELGRAHPRLQITLCNVV